MNYHLTLSNLKDEGHRITKVRKAIIKIFSQASKPLIAKKIKELLLELGLSVNKTTIYRELQFLLANNYLTEVYLHPQQVSYESSKLRHHHHLVCDNCGKVDSITHCPVMALADKIYKKKGFRIKRHTLEFYGTCADCAKTS
jgi:Fur family ferric uptake transcriptional regulator